MLWEHTNGDAQAVEANEVLAAVAAGDLLAVAALGRVVLGADVDLGVLVRSTLGGGEGNSGHGGDEERLEEGHFGWLGFLVEGVGKEASVGVVGLDWLFEVIVGWWGGILLLGGRGWDTYTFLSEGCLAVALLMSVSSALGRRRIREAAFCYCSDVLRYGDANSWKGPSCLTFPRR
jgi:hypothetical protein